MSTLDLIISDGQWERATCRLKEVCDRTIPRLINKSRVWRAEDPIPGEKGLYVWIYRDPRMVWQVTAGPSIEPKGPLTPWPKNVAEGKGFMAGSAIGTDSPVDPKNAPWEEFNPARGRFEPFPKGFVACMLVEEEKVSSVPPSPRRTASFDPETFAAFGGTMMMQRSASSLVAEFVEPSVVADARRAAMAGVLHAKLPAFDLDVNGRPPPSFSSYRVLPELVPSCEAFATGVLGLPPATTTDQDQAPPTTTLRWCPVGLPHVPLADLTQLIPLPTDGDGNCLLHAVSLGMWGLHAARPPMSARSGDGGGAGAAQQKEPLRGLLDRMLRHEEFVACTEVKWQAEQRRQNEALGEAMISEGADLMAAMSAEWRRAVDEAGRPGVFLGKLHIYALSQALKRPIIVFQDPGTTATTATSTSNTGGGSASAGSSPAHAATAHAHASEGGGGVSSGGGGARGGGNNSNNNNGGGGGDFGDDMAGVYLPTLWGVHGRQHECCLEPLVVLFNGRDHFTALVFPHGPVTTQAAADASAACAALVQDGGLRRVTEACRMSDEELPSQTSKHRNPTGAYAAGVESEEDEGGEVAVCRCVPLHRTDGSPLPVRFSNPGDDEPERREELLREYLDVVAPWGETPAAAGTLPEPALCAVSRGGYLLPESRILRDAHRVALLRKLQQVPQEGRQQRGSPREGGVVPALAFDFLSEEEADLQEALRLSTLS